MDIKWQLKEFYLIEKFIAEANSMVQRAMKISRLSHFSPRRRLKSVRRTPLCLKLLPEESVGSIYFFLIFVG
jgi:hypothetical protein